MKKVVFTFIAIILLCFAIGCGGSKDNDKSNKIDYLSKIEMPDASGKSFFKDGIGEVKLAKTVDGDTAHFRDENNKYIEGRFLGIDTPETTITLQEYGKKASNYTKNLLINAKKIVLESDKDKPEHDSNERYLVYVWADGKLINLGLVQEGLAVVEGISGRKYQDIFYEADAQAIRLKLGLRSNKQDDDYFYGDAIEITLKDFNENAKKYLNKRVTFEAVVTRKLDKNAYVEAVDETNGKIYGAFIFTMYRDLACFKVGNKLKINGFVGFYETTGRYQIIDVTYSPYLPDENDIKILEKNIKVEPKLYTIEQIGTPTSNPSVEYTFVKIENLEAISSGSYTNKETGAITVMTKDQNGKFIPIRIDKSASIAGIESHKDLVGKKFDLEGLVSIYDGNYQIMLVATNDLTIK